MNDRFSAFRHSSYRRYFLSRFMTSLAAQVVSVAVAWQMYDVTQNAALLGWIGLVQFLPALVLVVVTGVASDGSVAGMSWERQSASNWYAPG